MKKKKKELLKWIFIAAIILALIFIAFKVITGNATNESCKSAWQPCSFNADCCSGLSCQGGTCKNTIASSTCTDSDFGKNYSVLGTIEYKEYDNAGSIVSTLTPKDVCTYTKMYSWGETNIILKEYYCENNALKYEEYVCPKERCMNGACVPEETNTFCSSAGQTCVNFLDNNFDLKLACIKGVCTPKPLVCTDSDSGKEYFTRSTVSGWCKEDCPNSNNIWKYLNPAWDYCFEGMGSTGKYLAEGYCDTEGIAHLSVKNNYSCFVGCINSGTCYKSPKGGICNSTLLCNDGLICESGICVLCKSKDVSCSDSNQCCSGLTCQSGLCKTAIVTPLCKSSGQSCSSTSNCCSGLTCQSGLCKTSTTDTTSKDITLNLDKNNPNSDVVFEGKSYQVGLVSASDTTAIIKITNTSGKSITQEVAETQSKAINGLKVVTESANGNTLEYSASIIVSPVSTTDPVTPTCKSSGQSCTSNSNCCSGLTCQYNSCKCISKGQSTSSASLCCSKSSRYKWFWFKRYRVCN